MSDVKESIKHPKLDTSGKEWTSWKACLLVALQTRGLNGYLDGTMLPPIDPALGKSPAWVPTTLDEVNAVKAYKKALAEWTKEDGIAKHTIAMTLPNPLFMHILQHNTTKGYFDTLKAMFKQHLAVVGVNLR